MKTSLIFLGALFPLAGFAQVTPIYTIQGSGASSPIVTQNVTTEGVVYADFQTSALLNGFFIQDTVGDGNPATSDGIFVYNPGGTDVNVGDYVTVTGQVQEFYDLTELGNVTNVTIVGTANVIAPVAVSLPAASLANFEAIEGMFVTFPQTLTVTDQFNLGKYGEFTLASDRLEILTNLLDPNDSPASGTTASGSSNVAAITALADLHIRSQILVDDARTPSYPNPVPYIDPATHTLRNGSTTQNIRGAFSYSFSKYRLMPVQAPVFAYAPRPAVPAVSGDLKVVSFNILNFFTTIDDGANGARGADSPAEYVRQRDKLVAALDSLDADIYALIEVENNGTTAADSIVSALNASVGSPTYALVTENAFTGAYAIKNVFIYKTATVTPLDTMMTSTNLLFYPPPIAHQFNVNATGGRFNLIANHYRYKGCDGATGADLDQLDGQGCYNEARRQQSFELLGFFDEVAAATGNNRHLIVGDFNSYEQEDPIDIFVGAGYTKLINDSYSYAYRAEFGMLDHAFASPALSMLVNDAKIWHINADEPPALDYNMESVTDDLYAVHPYRSSDHDPVLIGLSPSVLETGEAAAIATNAFPNPFKDELVIQSNETVDVVLTDLSGRTISTVSGLKGTYKLNTSGLPEGVILVTFYQEGKQVSRRFVKY